MLTSEQQINRLLRPGSTYFNLNPFEVLQIEPDLTVDQIKKRYRSLSFLVHPDKNQDNKERAQLAFEAVNKAWKTLENDVTRKRCLDIYEEAKDRTDHMVRLTNKPVFNELFIKPFCHFRSGRSEKSLKKRAKPMKSFLKTIQINTNMLFTSWS